MKPIGGYFELELRDGNEYHPKLLKLNSGRNALEYCLRINEFKKVYLPYYICDAVVNTIKKLAIEYEFYFLDKNFSPMLERVDFEPRSAVLYVNYWGLNDEIVNRVCGLYENVIIDNSQAFYYLPRKKQDFIYSPRKFFGVADGGYLSTGNAGRIVLQPDYSQDQMGHLLTRLENGAEAGYAEFLRSEAQLGDRPLLAMSSLTEALLRNIDYKEIRAVRVDNFIGLHGLLRDYNRYEMPELQGQCPMVYPFLSPKSGLREFLIENKIFVAKYWPEVLGRVDVSSFEYDWTQNLVPLPIDQRYSASEMDFIVDKVKEFCL